MNPYEKLWCARHIHNHTHEQDVFLIVSESQPTKEKVVELATAMLEEGDQLTVRHLRSIDDGSCVVLCECRGVHPGEQIDDEVLLFGKWPGDMLAMYKPEK